VGFIDHDVAQVEEEVVPAFVVGEQAEVDHVGIGEQDPGLLPGHLSGGGRGISVVGGDLDLFACEHAEAPELILGQSLSGIEVHGAGVGITQKTVDHR